MVNRIVTRLMMLASIFALSGCAAPLLMSLLGGSSSASPAATAAPATLVGNPTPPSIFDELERSTRVGLVGPAAFLSENVQLDVSVINEQCRFSTPDPPFLVPTDLAAQKGWVFLGRLNSEDQLRAMQTLAYRSFFGWGWTKQQTNTWPLDMTTLSEMPNAYLEPRLAMIAGAKLDKAQQDQLAHEYIDDSQKIGEVVGRLQSGYNPLRQCPQRPS
jgi:hypothetical protein